MLVDGERDDDVIEIGQVRTALQISLAIHLVGMHQAEIHHEGKGIAGRDGRRIHIVDHLPVAGRDTGATHALMISRTLGNHIADAKNGIRRMGIASAGLGRKTDPAPQDGSQEDQQRYLNCLFL